MFSIWHSNDIAGGIKTGVKKGVNWTKILLTAQKLTAFLSGEGLIKENYRRFSGSVTCGLYRVSFQLTWNAVQLKAEIMVTTG
ncbi:hypothetical protein GCM10011500_44060 [Mucilaginibacter rubeus]|nr:hypothetical protein GCM10011500_44060 [Mucilaginibacter rubeus]